MFNIIVVVSAVLALVACKQDPYGGEPPTAGPPPKKIEKPEPLPGADGLHIQDIMQFAEGQKAEFIIRATVKGTGKPKLHFQGLPTGATYDPVTERLSWSPDFAAANDPRDPSVLNRNYYVDVSLFSSDDPVNERYKQRVILNVTDTPKPASVKSPLEMNGDEGQTLTHVINFEDLEYPNGPFEIALSGFPFDAELIWPDRRVPSFTLRWTPGYTKVMQSAGSADFFGDVVIYDPRGRRLAFPLRWRIQNVPVGPIVSGPDSVIQPSDIDFIVMAEDPSGEEAPEWSTAVSPAYGFFTVTTQPVPNSPTKSMGLVTWKGIPKDKLGLISKVELKACVRYSYCTVHKANLLATNPPPAPARVKGVRP
jgi:hypothetical protein